MSQPAEKDAPPEIGTATSRGYCYICPTPIEVGEMWRRERVGDTVPHSFRLVHHPACPPVNAESVAELLAHHRLYGEDGDDAYECGCGVTSPPEAQEEDFGELVWHERHVAEILTAPSAHRARLMTTTALTPNPVSARAERMGP